MAPCRLLAIVGGGLAAVVTAGCKDSGSPPASITVTAVSPAGDLLGGGSSVTITGTNFIDVTSVTIGSGELGNRSVVSATEITGTTPAAANPGATDVVVTSSSHGSGICRGCWSYTWLSLQAQSLAGGVQHTCGLTSSGAAYCWGSNSSGELGDGSTTSRVTPVAVSGGLSFGAIDGGGDAATSDVGYTCGLTLGGEAYCWGSGFGTSSIPVVVSGGLTFSAITAGDPHTCGLTRAGVAYCWGGNSAPVAVPGGLSFRAITGGDGHTCGLTSAGAAYCWGANNFGQLGLGTTTGPETCDMATIPCSSVPVPVATALRWASITAGGSTHTCGVTADGQAYCWGANQSGQLGVGTSTGPETCAGAITFPCSTVPVPVTTALRWASLTAGVGRTCGVTRAGEAYCWGRNDYGQLGTGSTTPASIPMAVSGGLSFSALATGGNHTCGLTMSGAAYCWGNNAVGQLGDGTTTNSAIPVAVAGWP